MKLSVGDTIISDPTVHGTEIQREIVDVRKAGYGWKYPDLGETTPIGTENYFWSENSTDPFFDYGWRKAEGKP